MDELSTVTAALSEEALRVVLAAVPVAMLAVDAAGTIVAANPYVHGMFGVEKLAGQPLNTVAPARRDVSRHPWLSMPAAPLLSRTVEEDMHFKGRRQDGSSFPVEVGHSPMDVGGHLCHLFTLVDLSARKSVERRLLNLSIELAQRSTELEVRSAELTERTAQLEAEGVQRRRVEADLQRSHEDFRYLFQRAPLPMWLYTPHNGSFLEVNDAALTHYGYSREEFLSMSMADIHTVEQMQALQAKMQQMRGQEFVQSRNWKHRTRDGKIIEVDIYSRALGSGAAAVRFVIAVDVTERNATEARLRQAQKMEALGQLTGGVAHDFNNLLTVILGNLEAIAEDSADRPAVHTMASDALKSVRRGSELTQRLLAFSRQQPLEPRLINTAALVQDMAGLFRRSLSEAIRIEHHIASGLWNTRADTSQLENALLNLAVNARDAMPDGGTLTMEAQNTVLDADYARVNPEAAAGQYVQISVSDTGTGMSREVLEHILEPFFTTKPVGQGTGLGLSMVYGFVKQSGGHLKIYSELGHGTTVKLYLPYASGKPEEPPPALLTAVMPRSTRGEVILLVEDDPSIRKLVERLLSMLGYQPVGAPDAATALSLLESIDHVDLLFTDLILPNGMSGAHLADQARAHHPELKVLYMSGYTRNALSNDQLHDDDAMLLSKPFCKEELARTVHRALNGG